MQGKREARSDLESFVICDIGLKDVNIFSPSQLGLNFLLCLFLITDKADDNVIRILGQLVQELELGKVSTS